MNEITKLGVNGWNKYAKINKLGKLKNLEVLDDYTGKIGEYEDPTRVLATFENKENIQYLVFNNYGLISLASSLDELFDQANSYTITTGNNKSLKKASIEMIKILSHEFGTEYNTQASAYYNHTKDITEQKIDTIKNKLKKYQNVVKSSENMPQTQKNIYSLIQFKLKIKKLLNTEKNLNAYIDYLNQAIKIVQSEQTKTNSERN